MHDQSVIVRYDGTQEGLGIVDNLCFTIMSHYIGHGGRDFFKASFIGVDNLLRVTGLNLDQIVIEPKNNGSC